MANKSNHKESIDIDPPNAQSTGDAVREQLSAYLDGELDDQTRRQLETRLSSDPKLREELARLERTWTLLDTLESPQVRLDFAQSTLEMLALTAETQLEKAEAELRRRQRRFWGRTLLTWFACAVVSFAAVAAFWPGPNDRLLELLPVLEHLDAYRQIDDVEFLRALEQRGLFAYAASPGEEPLATTEQAAIASSSDSAAHPSDSGGEETGAPEAADEVVDYVPLSIVRQESDDDRRRRIAAMSATRRNLVRQNLERFDTFLSPEERDHLLALHRMMVEQDDADALQTTMLRYHEWLRLLGTQRRAELEGLSDAARIDRIVAIQAEQAAEAEQQRQFDPRSPLPPELQDEDMTPVVAWLESRVAHLMERWLDRIPEEHRQRLRNELESLRRRPSAGKLAELFWWGRRSFMLRDRQGRSIVDETPLISEQDLEELRGLFSAQAEKYLAGHSAQEQRRLLMAMVGIHFFTKVKQFRESPEELAAYLENEMDEAEREQILNLGPKEDAAREITKAYLRSSGFGWEFFGRPPAGPGKPPGPPGEHHRGGGPRSASGPGRGPGAGFGPQWRGRRLGGPDSPPDADGAGPVPRDVSGESE